MPPHRFILILLAVVGLPTLLTFFSLLHAHPRGRAATESTTEVPKSGIRALFSFHTPSTLFPPSAIISLTDDNSTFFLSRPADFGPSLSANGLSGQLWIGSGFGDDGLGRGGAGTGAEGELGCSDVPGWDDDNQKRRRDSMSDQNPASQGGNEANSVDGSAGQPNGVTFAESILDSDEEPSKDDGTDDHLHHPLPTSPVSKPAEPGQAAQHQPVENGQPSTHADIQSLQESAEISEDSRRPPSSGRLDWFSEKWTDESPKEREASSKGKSKDQEKKDRGKKEPATSKETWKTGSHPSSSDDFVIGVQDWRDPDLVVTKAVSSKIKSTTFARSSEATPIASKGAGKGSESGEQRSGETFKGGSITPGSGQYLRPGHKGDPNAQKAVNKEEDKTHSTTSQSSGSQALSTSRYAIDDEEEHEGLWVTLTPTTMSSSPFFDTLLVLVVSPLVTLTVVYALLLLRSRIRRRRWRAPKSVVDRLPVRTYHTMSCASTTSSTRLPTPRTSSPSSPLLHTSPRSSAARARPRSATASEIDNAVSASLDRATAKGPAQQEKQIRTKRYKGKQVECVVCLEEYIDGQSQVMSLPCGHEFHAECITPWLTTRRRTCPICKGDVVRSMAHPSPTTSATDNQIPYHDNPSDDDLQVQVAETTNESPSAAIPIPRDADLERGEDMAATLVNDQDLGEASNSVRGWRGLAASLSLSAFSGEAAWRNHQQAHADRDR
ncbi:hypothetical protein P7C71_g3647, partial [Lecanoromycetidae sp. Uapishka_2]